MVLSGLMGAFNCIAGCCFEWVKTEAALLIAYGKNIVKLRTQVQKLSDAIESVKHRIEEAASIGATIVDPVVAQRQTDMASLKEEASTLIRDDEGASDCRCRCCCLMRLNLCACYRASKSAKKAIDKAAELLKEVNEYAGPVAYVDYWQSLGVMGNSTQK